MYIGKHEKIDVHDIADAVSGACFHGEVWMNCPHCGAAHEMVGKKLVLEKDGYKIYRCQCGGLFKDR